MCLGFTLAWTSKLATDFTDDYGSIRNREIRGCLAAKVLHYGATLPPNQSKTELRCDLLPEGRSIWMSPKLSLADSR
jgi:hypothetical protein